MNENVTYIPNRLKNAAKGGYVAGAVDIKDDVKDKDQQVINQETDEHFDLHDTEIADRYTKEEVNNIVSRTPKTDVIVIDIPAESQSDIAGWLDANTPSGTDPETGRSVRANKLYRVPGPDNTTYSEWAWDGTKYIMLANKDYGIDNEPIPESPNMLPSGAVASNLGWYKGNENPLWLYLIIDKNNKIIGGIKKDGSVEWTKGIPTPVKDYVDNNIQEVVNTFGSYNICQEYIKVVLDKDRRFLYGVKKDGSFEWTKGVPKHLREMIEAAYGTYTECPDWIQIVTDKSGKILYGVNEKGEFVWTKGIPIQIDDAIKKVSDKQVVENHMSKKNIAWYGTSIPAGSERASIGFDGMATSAKLPSDTYYHYDGRILPNQYPVITGSLLGVKCVYNESLGSSSAAKKTTPPNNSLFLLCKGLGTSVVQICEWLTECYNVNWVNHTYSRNTDNVLGVTTFLSDSTWNVLMQQFYTCVRMSYEVSLVSRYLISDTTEHSDYVESIFGEYYDSFSSGFSSAGLSLNGMCAYKADIDLFVFDHGRNDGNLSTVDATSMTTFEGAMNKFLSLIYLYKPSARVIIVSDYGVRPWGNGDVIAHQKALAERWQLPFIDMSKLLPVTRNLKVTTRGYWKTDAGNRKWCNTGFEYSEDGNTYTTNNSFSSMLATLNKQNNIQNVHDEFNPRQIDGIWYWDANPLFLWMWDGLHPHNDKEGRLTRLYAMALSQFIKGIGIL